MNKIWIWIIAILVIVAGVFYFSGSSGNYDIFAQCLTNSGAKMYGAYWCPHCLDQKKMFGNSWDKVKYIECSLPNAAGQTEECIAAGIKGYPTWEFGDGTRVSGTIPLERLSDITNCPLS